MTSSNIPVQDKLPMRCEIQIHLTYFPTKLLMNQQFKTIFNKKPHLNI